MELAGLLEHALQWGLARVALGLGVAVCAAVVAGALWFLVQHSMKKGG